MLSIVVAVVFAAFVQSQAPAALRIVVLEGEGGVNIIQQKTAVRPLVEIRDRNNVPVAGATVTFTIGGGGSPAAFAGGVQTLTVTTNAAGQAAAGGLNALSNGAFQIQVQAAYQGQLATAAISQTNFATAAAASQAGAVSGGASGGAGGLTGAASGAAGGGGGISGTTIGIVGAAVAGGGALAAVKTGVIGGGGEEGGFDAYRGSFSSPFVFTTIGTGGPISPSTCVYTGTLTGNVTIDLKSDGSPSRAYVEGSEAYQSVSGTQGCSLITSVATFTTPDTTTTGGSSALTFTNTNGGPGLLTKVTFSGSHSGNTITGSLTVETTSQSTSVTPGFTTVINGSGSATVPITLQR